jgi:hypothetical protein
MRRYTIAFAVALVAGCGGNGSTTVIPSSMPPSSSGSGATGGTDGGTPGDGGGGTTGGGGTSGGDMGGGGGGGTACTDMQPVAIASAEKDADAIAVDDSDVYFTTQPVASSSSDWDLWRAPVGGGAAAKVGSSGNYYAAAWVTVNATAAFTLQSDGLLMRWPKSGGAPSQLHASQSNVGVADLVDAFGYIYFSTYDSGYVQIIRTPEDGGGPETIVAAQNGLGNFTFDPTHIWISSTRGISGSAPDGSGPSVFIPSASNGALGPLAVDDAHVFVADNARTLWVADKRDGATMTVLAQTTDYPNVLIADGGNLYVLSATESDTSITRYAADGSRADLLAERAGMIGGMVVRGNFVYYTYSNDSTVYRICK